MVGSGNTKALKELKAISANFVIPDNISYQSFKPEHFWPVVLLSSSEDPGLIHRNIITPHSQSHFTKSLLISVLI